MTGNDLAYQVGKVYPRNARVLLWFLLEMSLLAADIQETVGCALAVQILSNGIIPLWASCILISAAAFLLLQVWTGHRACTHRSPGCAPLRGWLISLGLA